MNNLKRRLDRIESSIPRPPDPHERAVLLLPHKLDLNGQCSHKEAVKIGRIIFYPPDLGNIEPF